MGRRQQKAKLSAQLVEDEEYQLRHERVAGIDVAKASAVVCTRLPPVRDGGRRVSRVEEVTATVPEVAALAVRLLADGVQAVVMESTSDYWRGWYYVLEAHGLEVDFAVLFDRATILEGGDRGLKLWLEMFGRFAVEAVSPEQRKEFFRIVNEFAAPAPSTPASMIPGPAPVMTIQSASASSRASATVWA